MAATATIKNLMSEAANATLVFVMGTEIFRKWMKCREQRTVTKSKMEACAAVEKEVDKVLSKFNDANVHAANSLDDILQYINGIRKELVDGENHERSLRSKRNHWRVFGNPNSGSWFT